MNSITSPTYFFNVFLKILLIKTRPCTNKSRLPLIDSILVGDLKLNQFKIPFHQLKYMYNKIPNVTLSQNIRLFGILQARACVY